MRGVKDGRQVTFKQCTIPLFRGAECCSLFCDLCLQSLAMRTKGVLCLCAFRNFVLKFPVGIAQLG